MKKPSHRNIGILIVSAICFITIGFALKSMFTPKPVINPQIDVSKYLRSFDSLKALNNEKDTKILLLKVRFDSLSIAKEINHSTLHNGLSKTYTYTATNSKRHMDSVFAAETR